MEEQMARRLVAAEGKKLQQAGLVARTWGNISCRIDENHFVITPSGLDYETMTARDLVLMDIRNGVCCGAHKPSSEKGVHLAAYQTFPEVGYVIHTHQTYATAIGLCGFEQLAMMEEEAEKLGGIARAFEHPWIPDGQKPSKESAHQEDVVQSSAHRKQTPTHPVCVPFQMQVSVFVPLHRISLELLRLMSDNPVPDPL